MCGIAGAYALAPGARVNSERVHRMSCLLAHRGPDESGFWEDPRGRACFGHRRLSIIDLTTGQQPMMLQPSGQQITFNGEIYNYIELRRELDTDGPALRTSSDTEILLRLLAVKGVRAPALLRGMFAFAYYDPSTHRLILARDRLGKKPLFHTVDDGVLYFSSSFSALRAVGCGAGTVDIHALDEFLDLGYIPAPRSIDPGISKLPAATILVAESGTIRTEVFWDPATAREPFDGSLDDAVDRLEHLLTTAVDIRLRSDVPLGVFLSGGIDSSLIAAIAARRVTGPLLTFSIGFDEQGFDESGHASEVARLVGSEHCTFRTRYDAVNLLPDIVRHFGEPFGDSSAIPTWQLARETRRHVKVAMGGDGGDEGFGGYNWYRTAARLRRIRRAVPARAADAVTRMLSGSSPASAVGRMERAAALLSRDDADCFATLRSFVGGREAARLYARELLSARGDGESSGHRRLAEIFRSSQGSSLRAARIVDIATYLADDLLPKVDVATMAHGLELRAPLLDHLLIEFALSLDDRWITDRLQGKKLLRMLISRYLPVRMFDRPKHGFSVPLADWFTRELRPLVLALDTSPPLMDSGWFQPDGIRALVSEHLTGARNHSQRLFNLLVLEEWLRQR